MPYSAEISRSNPTCFLFLIDQSKSMLGPIGGGQGKKKADAVADSINRLLYSPALAGTLAERELVPISELARSPLRVEQRINTVDDGRGGEVEQIVKSPVWFEPVAHGKTPMNACLGRAGTILSNFLLEHSCCHPPLV